MHIMPKLGQHLTGCAIWAKACFAELDQGIQEVAINVPLVPDVCQLQHKSPHPYCAMSGEQGVFQIVHLLILLGLKVSCR